MFRAHQVLTSGSLRGKWSTVKQRCGMKLHTNSDSWPQWNLRGSLLQKKRLKCNICRQDTETFLWAELDLWVRPAGGSLWGRDEGSGREKVRAMESRCQTLHRQMVGVFVYFLITLFWGCIHGIWKVPGQGSNPHHSNDNAGSWPTRPPGNSDGRYFSFDFFWIPVIKKIKVKKEKATFKGKSIGLIVDFVPQNPVLRDNAATFTF